MYITLISPEILHKNINTPNWKIFDCRTALTDPDQGRRDYEHSHIPGAIFADLKQDLCGPILPRPNGFTETGRHPLPDVDTFVATLHRWGVNNKTQVIAYDDKGGGLSAARLWWMLRWVGHDAVAVLDGGWQGWVGKQYAVVSGQYSEGGTQGTEKPFEARVQRQMLVGAEEVYTAREEFLPLQVFDSRAPERYRGETEPIDPVAGRVPWALNAPYTDTQTPEGFFRPQKELKGHFEKLLMNTDGKNTIFYCGSGVTAAANLLALKHAGLGEGKLYAGSWSDWITDPARPVAVVQSYTAPVDVLITLGEDPAREYPWPDYLQYGLTSEHIPDLIRMATDYDLNWARADDPKVFAPLHAWRALGQLRAEAAIEPLLPLFHVLADNEWTSEELPDVYALIGPVAIPALAAYLQDESHDFYARSLAMASLEKIGTQTPGVRDQCVAILTRQLEKFDQQGEDLNGFLVSSLVILKAVEAAPVMARAFAADKVDDMIMGDWEDVQIQLGLLTERTASKPDKLPLFPRDFSTDQSESDRFPFAPKKDAKKEKSKRKQEKQSRKANQKKKKKK